MDRLSYLLLIAVAVLAGAPVSGADYVRPRGPSLRELALERGLHIGANFGHLVFGRSPNNWQDNPYLPTEKAIARDHFTIMTAGWENFPGHSWGGPGEYELSGTEHTVEWCLQHDVAYHFHGLGYVQRTPWFMDMPAETEKDLANIRRVYEDKVRDYVQLLAGRVKLWDVCNEHIAPGRRYQADDYWVRRWDSETESWRLHPYVRAYQGDSEDPEQGLVRWMARTFQLAHEIDPDATLIYLDFGNEVVGPTSNTMMRLVEDLRRADAPIHGVGFQMHLNNNLALGADVERGHGYETDDAYFDSMRANFRRLADMGLELWITEMDVTIDAEGDPDAELERQAEIYRRVFETVVECEAFRGVKTWGILDARPWGPSETRRYLFDDAGRPKPAFYAVQDVLAGYHPQTVAHDDFTGAATGRWQGEWSLSGPTADSTRRAPAADSADALVLRGSGATAERTVDLRGLRKAHLHYRRHAPDLTGDQQARLLLEAAVEDGDWQTVRVCDANAIGRRSPLEGAWQSVFATLPADAQGRLVGLRFRLEGAAGETEYALDELEVIADPVDE